LSIGISVAGRKLLKRKGRKVAQSFGYRHPRAGGDPRKEFRCYKLWTPAFAGVTDFLFGMQSKKKKLCATLRPLRFKSFTRQKAVRSAFKV
jgi:hypothetical protein